MSEQEKNTKEPSAAKTEGAEGKALEEEKRDKSFRRILLAFFIAGMGFIIGVEGEQKRPYVGQFYNKGETVYVFRNRKLKDMVVVDE